MTATARLTDIIERSVSLEQGEIDRRIFSDPDIFELEMDLIFGRSWLFLCHESQIPKRGDFVEAPMGRDNVLVVRQRDGSIKALLNTCSHRGNAVCRAEQGNVRNFMCTYHGWTYDLDGALIGVPGRAQFYGDDLDVTKHPLKSVAQLDTYEGFVFATHDASAPPLYDLLGTTGRLGLDLLALQGDMEAVPGVQKFVIDANWKFAVDNLFDFYHPQITHMSAMMAWLGGVTVGKKNKDENGARTSDGKDLAIDWKPQDLSNLVVLGEYGHAIAGPPVELKPDFPGLDRSFVYSQPYKERLGRVGARVAGNANIFPTAWISPTTTQISLRIPRSATQTEIWWLSFADRNMSAEERKVLVRLQNQSFGPAGMLEQEDGENWAQSTMQTHGHASRTVPQLLKMGTGRGKINTDDGLRWIEASTNEHGQLWTYASWKQWMLGWDWNELYDHTTPGDYI